MTGTTDFLSQVDISNTFDRLSLAVELQLTQVRNILKERAKRQGREL